MLQKTINLYSINELSDKAKEYALQQWNNTYFDYPWESENKSSLEAFCDTLNIRIDNRGNWKMLLPYAEDICDLTGIRAMVWLINNVIDPIAKPKYLHKGAIGVNTKSRYSKLDKTVLDCPFTGYYMDMELLDPIIKFIKHPSPHTSISDIIDDCLQSYEKAVENAIESMQTMEYFIDTCAANGYTFRESGEMDNDTSNSTSC